jgi:circadian clock protein KaiC
MFGGKGFFRSSSILVSGSSGTGKTSIASYFANESCKRKDKCLFFAFEESPQQIIRNMRSIGLDLNQHVKKGLLEFHSFRPGLYGLEMHLAKMYKIVEKFKPQIVILDPITNLVTIGLLSEVNSMLLRLIDYMQSEGITLMLTALNSGVSEHIDENVSSLVDAWLLVKDVELDGERNRAIYIMKSRGMKHSNEVREFIISSKGLNLVEVCRGPNGILLGTARETKMKEEKAFAKRNKNKSFNSRLKKI